MRLSWLALATLTGCANPDTPMDPDDATPIRFEVPAGSTAGTLGDDLVELGLVDAEWRWKLFLRQEDGSCLKAGTFELDKTMSKRQIIETLCGAPLPDDVPFTVVEGWRIRDIDAALAKEGFIEAGAYIAVAEGKTVEAPFEVTSPTYEGYLYPETYMVPPKDRFEVDAFVERQLATFQETFLAKHPDGFGERSLHEVVIMASMLEREEPKDSQRPVTAGILWKRIDHGWQLGVDATSRYTLDDWSDRKTFLVQLRDPEDPYNTRIHKGLPPTAIGNPAISSLEAAIAPEDSEYWFYLHDHEGTFHGAVDAAGHEANRKKYDVY